METDDPNLNADAVPDAPPGDAPPPPIPIDPFGFVPGHISRVAGLGGDLPGPFESYVFHTPYATLGEGHLAFVMTFEGLAATKGTLDLIVHAMSPRTGARAHPIEIQRIPLRLLEAEDGGRATIQFEALSGMTYSLFGQIFDDTDARADGLSIAVWQRSELRAESAERLAGRQTEFGAADLKPVARLVSGKRPSLAEPVSQMCTSRQLAEPPYREWLAALGLVDDRTVAGWGQAFVMQALRRYGVLLPRARGVGVVHGGGPLPAAMAAAGCNILATGMMEDGLAALRRPDLCDDATFDAHVAYRRMEPGGVAEDAGLFDFFWSMDWDGEPRVPAETMAHIDAAMAWLKPGGTAVHVVAYDPDPAAMPSADPGPLCRREMERVALALISRGHEVAQFKYDTADVVLERHGGRIATAFGIIVRHGLLS